MNPYYKIDDITTTRILGLIDKCKELSLGNVSFVYFALPKHDEIRFRLTEDNHGWELVVIARRTEEVDAYRITEDKLVYEYSEKD